MTAETVAAAMDRAATARDVAFVTALALLQTGGDGHAALGLLESLVDVAPPESFGEIDCVTVSQQAIRDALAARGQL